MGLNDIWRNPLVNVDDYYLSTWYLKTNKDWEVSHMTNRSRPMILYGFNELVMHVFNKRIEVDMVMEADEKSREMDMDFDVNMWMQVVDKFQGRIPVQVQALPDGTWCPIGTPFAQIKNTEEGFGECASYMEGVLMHQYFASGCATEAFHIAKYLKDNGLPNHRVHSFGYRGYPSQESAYWGGTAWNLFLTGTDDFHTKLHTTAPVKSISASAHKVIQQFDNEYEAYIYHIDAVKKRGKNIVAFPIDTHDADRFIHQYAVKIMRYALEQGIHLVLRPDSGDVVKQAIDIYNITVAYGFKNVSVIIGEGMSLSRMKEYDAILKKANVPLEFVFYGIGAGFYKHIDRDWLGWAMKTSYSNGKNRMKTVKSNPYKQSIPGVVNIIKDENGNLVVDYTRDGHNHDGLYYDIYHFSERSNRPEFKRQTWDEIYKIAQQQTCTQERIILSPLVIAERDRIVKEYD